MPNPFRGAAKKTAIRPYQAKGDGSQAHNLKWHSGGTSGVTPELAITLTNEMLWTGILMALPVLGLSTLVGLLVSIIQVVTQIQDISLTFVPKMLTVALAMVFIGPWMMGVLVEFARSVIGNIPSYF